MKIQALFGAILAATAAAVKVGDVIPPDANLHFGFPPESINLKNRIAGKKVLIIGLPGAFTPT
jgi:peroxiredoxin